MIPFLDIYGLLSVILRALALISEALMVGGVIFTYVVVARHSTHPLQSKLMRMVAMSAGVLVASELAYVAINSAVLRLSTHLTWLEICGASFVVSGAAAIAGAGMCGMFALVRRPNIGAALAIPGGCILALASSTMSSHSAA